MSQELKDMLAKATESLAKRKTEVEAVESALATSEKSLNALKASNDTINAETASQIESLKTEISNLRTKQAESSVILPADQSEAIKSVAVKAIGAFVASKTNEDLATFAKSHITAQFKALNITNPAEGGLAVAEVLSREVIEYAREVSPIVNLVGRKTLTRDFRELVELSEPSTQAGIENVAGVTIAETTTPVYAEVKASTIKINAKPRLTDESMVGTDIDVYGRLIAKLGVANAKALATQLLYGDGSSKSARGILSTNRVDVTNLTGKSFMPTLDADVANMRNADYFPVLATGVSGSIGTSDKLSVDYILDVCNALPTAYLGKAKWVMNRKTKAVIEKLRDADERPIFRNGYQGEPMNINGYPLVIDDTMPDIAANSSFAIFGDISSAFCISNGQVNKMLVDPYTVDGCTVLKSDIEYFEMVQASDAILVCNATTNAFA